MTDDLKDELIGVADSLARLEHDSIDIAKSAEQIVYMLRQVNNQADVLFHGLLSVLELCKNEQYINRDKLIPIIRAALIKSIERVN